MRPLLRTLLHCIRVPGGGSKLRYLGGEIKYRRLIKRQEFKGR